MRCPREMLSLPKSYSPIGFSAVWKSWSERQRFHYRQSIERQLKGDPLTQVAHDCAVAMASGANSPGTRLADAMRKAVEHPEEFKF